MDVQCQFRQLSSNYHVEPCLGHGQVQALLESFTENSQSSARPNYVARNTNSISCICLEWQYRERQDYHRLDYPCSPQATTTALRQGRLGL